MFAMFLFDAVPTPVWCFLLLAALMIMYRNQSASTRAMLDRALGICEKMREESWAKAARIRQLEGEALISSKADVAPERDHAEVLKAFRRPTQSTLDLLWNFCRQWGVNMLDSPGLEALILHGSPENINAFAEQLQGLGHPLTPKASN